MTATAAVPRAVVASSHVARIIGPHRTGRARTSGSRADEFRDDEIDNFGNRADYASPNQNKQKPVVSWCAW